MVKRRTLPSKRKSVLVCCEGKEGSAFIKYLRSQFANPEVKIIVRSIHGDANSVLDKTARFCISKAYDLVVCVYDDDRDVDSKREGNCRRLCGQDKTILIKTKPCLEAFLLQILEGKNYSHRTKCGSLKTRFERNYISRKKRTNPDSYAKHFPKPLLTRRAHQIPDLQRLIDVISGKNLK